jgi:hypothetical protein
VNYNEAENGRISTLLNPARRIGRLLAILPRHIHTGSEGFGGDPTAWKEDEGLITLDLEQMATRFRAHAHRIGSHPGVFLEFLVPAGACRIGAHCPSGAPIQCGFRHHVSARVSHHG